VLSPTSSKKRLQKALHESADILFRRQYATGTQAVEHFKRKKSPTLPEPNFGHLEAMTGPLGLWEHALFSSPRFEHGMCTDDNARAIILLNREPALSVEQSEVLRICFRFLEEASLSGGGFHNRRRADGAWADSIGSDDSQGRAIWALGSSVRYARDAATRDRALELFKQQAFTTPSPRANAFAVLGATEVLARAPDDQFALDALENWVAHLKILDDPLWPWPEQRLAYDNARIPEALMAGGAALGNAAMVGNGIDLLEWLVETETQNGHFSFTPARGWALGESRPGFDQQPLEAAAFAEACSRAWAITGEARWRDYVLEAAMWFLGNNDAESVMYDRETGGGYDGLTPEGVNLNQGAESTLAALSTLQRAGKIS
jgi:hypothetical protein